MAPWTTLTQCCSHLSRQKPPPLSLVPITLAFVTSFLIVLYMSFTTDTLFFRDNISTDDQPVLVPLARSNKPHRQIIRSVNDDGQAVSTRNESGIIVGSPSLELAAPARKNDHGIIHNDGKNSGDAGGGDNHVVVSNNTSSTLPSPLGLGSSPGSSDNTNVFHDEEVFLQNYEEMKRTLKIYIYPHNKNDPFANALLPVDGKEPGGNYASETYFKNVLYKSHFITDDPSKADLFFLPFSIARLRHDRRIGVGGLQDFIKNYMMSITRDYTYWNRTGGADHFYVACHSIGRMAMEKVEHVKANAIQVICSSSYFLTNYYAHKDVCLPQIWPRHEEPPNLASSKRKKLAFFAGSMNSPVRKAVLRAWKNDTSIFAHSGRLKTPYSDQLLGSKYCLHVKGFEVNTARIGDAMYYGCVPVVIADHYDLPFMDILNWRSFSVVVRASDIPNLKKILEGIGEERYEVLQRNVLKVRRHFQWNREPVEFDAFYMIMYELWLRRSSIRVLSF